MKRPNRPLNSNDVLKIKKESEKVQKLIEKIAELGQQIADIKEENNWLNYLSKECISKLTDEENIELAESFETMQNS